MTTRDDPAAPGVPAGDAAVPVPFTGMTRWTRRFASPLQRFLRTEAGGAAVLVTGTLVALVWANVATESYETVWNTHLTASGRPRSRSRCGGWVNSGLMTFFFFVVGLEARREFDLGDLRERRRFALPLAAGLGGMLVPGRSMYLAVNAGRHGLARVGRRHVDRHRLRARHARPARPAGARGRSGCSCSRRSSSTTSWPCSSSPSSTARTCGSRRCSRRAALSGGGRRDAGVPESGWGCAYAVVGAAVWLGVLESGVDPIVVGLVMGLLTLRLQPLVRRPRPGRGAVPQVPGAADARVRPQRRRRAGRVAVAQRPAAAALAAVDQLRDRPAVRAGERRDRRRCAASSRGR